MAGEFPNIPVPHDKAAFEGLATLGWSLTEVHLLRAVEPLALSIPVPSDCTIGAGCPRYLAPGEPDPLEPTELSEGRIYINGPANFTSGQYLGRVAAKVWDFSVGGHPVIKQWLYRRKGTQVGSAELDYVGLLAAAVLRTGEIQKAIDSIRVTPQT